MVLTKPIIIEEITTAIPYEINESNPRHVCKSSSGLLIEHCSFIGNIIKRKSRSDKITIPSIAVGDLENVRSIHCSPFMNNEDISQKIENFCSDGDIVHVTGIMSIFFPESKNGILQDPIFKLTLENISIIPEDNIEQYVKIWYLKLLQKRRNERLPCNSKLYKEFVKNNPNIMKYVIVDDIEQFFIFNPPLLKYQPLEFVSKKKTEVGENNNGVKSEDELLNKISVNANKLTENEVFAKPQIGFKKPISTPSIVTDTNELDEIVLESINKIKSIETSMLLVMVEKKKPTTISELKKSLLRLKNQGLIKMTVDQNKNMIWYSI